MQIVTVSPNFMVGPQLIASDLETAATNGIKTIINNRPDREGPGQPPSADLADAAASAGLAYVHMPVTGPGLTDEKASEFDRVCSDASGPVLAFCASGTRSIALWALGQAKTRHADDVLADVAEAGYDLSAFRGRLLALNEANGNLDDIGGEPTS
jgi:sulfide:quinone oxidoreductase